MKSTRCTVAIYFTRELPCASKIKGGAIVGTRLSRELNRTSLFVAVVGALLAVAGAASIVSAHGGDTNLVHACVKEANGFVRIVGADEDCNQNEYALDWGIEGPAGPSGAAQVLDAGPIPNCTIAGLTPIACVARTLPAGSWTVSFRANIDLGESALVTRTRQSCDVLVDGTVIDSYDGRAAQNGDVVVMMATLTVPAPAQIEVVCHAEGGLTFQHQKLLATSVGSTSPW
jgi:hypothetical protein